MWKSLGVLNGGRDVTRLSCSQSPPGHEDKGKAKQKLGDQGRGNCIGPGGKWWGLWPGAKESHSCIYFEGKAGRCCLWIGPGGWAKERSQGCLGDCDESSLRTELSSAEMEKTEGGAKDDEPHLPRPPRITKSPRSSIHKEWKCKHLLIIICKCCVLGRLDKPSSLGILPEKSWTKLLQLSKPIKCHQRGYGEKQVSAYVRIYLI